MQTSFSELEYSLKKKQTRRDRFLAEIEAVTPWAVLEKTVVPFYPSSGGRGRPPIGLARMRGCSRPCKIHPSAPVSRKFCLLELNRA